MGSMGVDTECEPERQLFISWLASSADVAADLIEECERLREAADKLRGGRASVASWESPINSVPAGSASITNESQQEAESAVTVAVSQQEASTQEAENVQVIPNFWSGLFGGGGAN